MSRQEYDANQRILFKDTLWQYANDQAYFRMCERLHVFPNRKRINNLIYQTY